MTGADRCARASAASQQDGSRCRSTSAFDLIVPSAAFDRSKALVRSRLRSGHPDSELAVRKLGNILKQKLSIRGEKDDSRFNRV